MCIFIRFSRSSSSGIRCLLSCVSLSRPLTSLTRKLLWRIHVINLRNSLDKLSHSWLILASVENGRDLDRRMGRHHLVQTE
jgi:hypothetical protein